MQRPKSNEYAPFYAGYVSMVEEAEILPALEKQLTETQNFFARIPNEKADFAYAEGKWTIKEVLGHIIDAERVFAYRALRFSRGDRTPLASFDENFYVANADFQSRTIDDLVREFSLLRQANLIYFQTLTPENFLLKGIASNNEMSVRALAFVMVGHVRHHLKILRERYLSA